MKKSGFFLVLTLTTLLPAKSQEVRKIRDDVGYCWTEDLMRALIKEIKKTTPPSAETKYIAGISPHDDYLYAARIYYPLFSEIKSREVVIFGVTHGTVRKEIGDPQNILILDQFHEWPGIINPIPVSDLRTYIIKNLDTSYYHINNKAHELEHSIEGMLPFLQYFNPDIKITPIMVTAMQYSRMEEVSTALARILSNYIKEKNLRLGDDIFFLMSADANHYGTDFNNIPFGEDSIAHAKATAQDKRIAANYLAGSVEPEKVNKLTEEFKNVVWCGKYSIPVGLLTVNKVVKDIIGKHLYGKILMYSDTYTEGVLPIKGTKLGTTAPFSLKHWCGFLSAGYSITP